MTGRVRGAVNGGDGRRAGPAGAVGAGGYTVVEVVLVLALFATLAGVGWPIVEHLVVRREADAAIAHVERVRAEAEAYAREVGRWPTEAPPGEVPDELVGRLGPDASFDGSGYTLDWDVWPLPRGLPSAPEVGSVAGITVVAAGPGVDAWLREGARSEGWIRVGGGYTRLLLPPPPVASPEDGVAEDGAAEDDSAEDEAAED